MLNYLHCKKKIYLDKTQKNVRNIFQAFLFSVVNFLYFELGKTQ